MLDLLIGESRGNANAMLHCICSSKLSFVKNVHVLPLQIGYKDSRSGMMHARIQVITRTFNMYQIVIHKY